MVVSEGWIRRFTERFERQRKTARCGVARAGIERLENRTLLSLNLFGAPIPTGANAPFAIATADVNGDTKADLITANADGNSVSILLGSGAGTFAPAAGSPVSTGASTRPWSIAVTDFDRDGKLDLVTANRFTNSVSVLLGDGTGGFALASGSPVTISGLTPESVAVSDLNGDGKPDVVTANRSTNDLSVMLGDGAGGLTAPGAPIGVGTSPTSVASADINGDGKADLVAANYSSNNVSVLLGDGAGGFTAAGGSPVAVAGVDPHAVTITDVNGDGKPDLVTANRYSHNISVLLGDGAGGFTPAAGSPVATGGFGPFSAAVADINNDGKVDLIAADRYTNDVSVLLGNGTGAFAAPTGSPVATGGTQSIALVVADLSGDGSLDVATANFFSHDISVLLNDKATPANGQFLAAGPLPIITGGTTPVAIATGDVNRDGKPDFVTANQISNNVSVLLGDGAGGFTAAGPPVTVLGTQPRSIAIADFNSDARPDIVTANGTSGNVSLLLGNGSGGFAPAAGSPFAIGALNPAFVTVADFNRDGKPDLVTANSDSDSVSVLLGDGAGSFTAAGAPTPTGGFNPAAVAVADVNGDGKPDILVSNRYSDNVSVLLGDGTGAFTAAGAPVPSGGYGAFALAVADVSGDGKPDIAVTNKYTDTVGILLGNGAGGFTPAGGSPVPIGAYGAFGIAIADVNGDGKPDLMTANRYSDDVSVLLGNGAGAFAPAAGTPVPIGGALHERPVAIVVTDVNRDGRLDLLTANFFSNKVSVMLGKRNVASNFLVSAPVNADPGSSIFINAKARATSNMRDSMYTGTVAFSSSDAAAILPGNTPFSIYDDGANTFQMTLKTPGLQTITVTDTVTGSIVGAANVFLPFAYMVGNVLHVDFDGSTNPITLAVSGSDITATQNATTYTFPNASVASIIATGSASGDTLNINGVIIQPGVFNGGTGNDHLNVNAGTFTFNTDAATATPNLTLAVNTGAGVVFNASQHLTAFSLAAGATATLTANGERVLATQSLSVATTAVLDLKDNDLIVDYSSVSPIGTWNGTAYEQLAGLIAAGRNGGNWDGTGIISSLAAPSGFTALGIAEAAEAMGIGAGETALFSGNVVDSTSVLIKYTYGGDANLSGVVDVDDYGQIDFNSLLGGIAPGWLNGDFDFNGTANVDDYGLIDFVNGIQGPPL